VLYEAIVLSVLCSSQRNKEPFETKRAKSISRASEYRCKPAASRRESAVVTSDKCKLAASRRGSAVVSSARAIEKFKLLSFKSIVSIVTKLAQIFEENKKETQSYASKTIKTRSCPTYQGASLLRVVIYADFDHKKESSLL